MGGRTHINGDAQVTREQLMLAAYAYDAKMIDLVMRELGVERTEGGSVNGPKAAGMIREMRTRLEAALVLLSEVQRSHVDSKGAAYRHDDRHLCDFCERAERILKRTEL